MLHHHRLFAALSALVAGTLGLVGELEAATPSPAAALQLTPIQSGVRYDTPGADSIEQCKVRAQTGKGATGWIVEDGSGQLLRRFLDTNGDNKVDQWCYYKDGIEIYRDIDANFNGKADQYRWLGTAGMRWALDSDEDGQIDAWKAISPEEVTAEIVAALRERDAKRFQRLLLTKSEIQSLGLGEQHTAELGKKVATAAEDFQDLARRQKLVGDNAEWVHFGATHPGVIPAGTDGSKNDVIVYENVAAVVQNGSDHSQVAVGTLVKVDDTWRLIDLPKNLLEDQVTTAPTGYFFHASLARTAEMAGAPSGLTPTLQKAITDLEKIDQQLLSAAPDKQATLNAQRADLLNELADAAASPEDRSQWIRQFADTVGAAVQSGQYAGGVDRLKSMAEELAKNEKDAHLVPYVKFRYLTAEYGQSLQDPKADFAKIQSQWLDQLKGFVEAHPRADDSAEAMLQLAIAEEFAGNEEEARRWYGRILQDFPSAELAKKAEGARRRLDSVGKTIQLAGKDISNGRTVDLDRLRGQTVLVHYWATWCEPCKQDLNVLKDLQAKYNSQNFTLVGVSLDSDRQSLLDYLKTTRLPWPQLYEEGGLDSPLANQLGILTLPTMLLIDKDGKVVSRNIHAAELDAELGKLLRSK